MWSRIRDTYRRTSKPRDILWNRFVARPVAAVVVVLLERTSVTPNQVTLASLGVFLVAAAAMVTLKHRSGAIIAVTILELSYVLDCVDGQLARIRGTSSPIGAHFDFLMDELKAFLLAAVVGTRLWLASDNPLALLEGLAALVAVASGISLTTFIRRPEYAAATGANVSRGTGDYGEGFAAKPGDPGAPPAPRRSPVRRVVGAIESVGRLIIHYPSYLVFVAIANRLDLFLHAYLLINAAYAVRSMLGVSLKLGRSRP